MQRTRAQTWALLSISASLILGAGCKAKVWPDEPLVRRTSTKAGVTFSVVVPEELGAYEDPNGTIWRSAGMNSAVFVKVFRTTLPKNLDEAAETPTMEEGERITVKERTADGYRIVVRGTKSGRERYWVWKRRGPHAVYCHSLFTLKDATGDIVRRYNRWMRERCDSLQIKL